MKRIIIVFLLILSTGLVFSQEKHKPYKFIAGARVNPLVIYDFDGNRSEALRIHGELGLKWNKRWYFFCRLYTFYE
ncbi:MAG: hypothetical protein ACOCPM_06210 [Bacteroidales bacterium]